jgi:hypothetical protein
MEVPIPLQLSKLDEQTLAMAREFFSGPVGQRILQWMRYSRPAVTANKYDMRRTQMERRLGYEECFDTLVSLLRPKDQNNGQI